MHLGVDNVVLRDNTQNCRMGDGREDTSASIRSIGSEAWAGLGKRLGSARGDSSCDALQDIGMADPLLHWDTHRADKVLQGVAHSVGEPCHSRNNSSWVAQGPVCMDCGYCRVQM